MARSAGRISCKALERGGAGLPVVRNDYRPAIPRIGVVIATGVSARQKTTPNGISVEALRFSRATSAFDTVREKREQIMSREY